MNRLKIIKSENWSYTMWSCSKKTSRIIFLILNVWKIWKVLP